MSAKRGTLAVVCVATAMLMLDIAVVMRSPAGEMPTNPHWLNRCKLVFVDLRAYLMGQEGGSKFQ